ncbi:MAG: class I SAM-dependent methyltransferase [Acidimicrobiales bacterium]|nr:MAG: class I SAM-dependent methyltransferase [Acidimicrobiales bacterium]
MRRRPQLVPWKAAGRTSERQASGDDVVRTTGWVFNNETGSELTLEQFVATGDSEVPAYLTVFGLRTPDADGRVNDDKTLVEIGSGIGRMTCAFTREFGTVVACDLDAGFLERCIETVSQFGKVDRLRTSHVTDGHTLDLPPNSTDIAFSYITLQHCEADDALELTSEAVRITRPGGKVVLNYRARGAQDIVLLPLGAVARAMFRIPRFGPWLSQHRWAARLGWQANRLQPDELIGPLSSLLTDIEIWRNPKSKISGRGAVVQEFDGINRHHHWLIATVR